MIFISKRSSFVLAIAAISIAWTIGFQAFPTAYAAQIADASDGGQGLEADDTLLLTPAAGEGNAVAQPAGNAQASSSRRARFAS